MPDQLLPFLIVVGVLTLTPGPDMALVLQHGIKGGVRAAWMTGLGCCAGITVWAAAASVGLAALLASSAVAFEVIKILGALYLGYLGMTVLWRARPGQTTAAPAQLTSGPTEPRTAFRQGLVSNLLNPKIALIFLTLLPQFITPGEPASTTVTLAAAFLALAVLWWRLFSLAIGLLGRVLARQHVRLAVERVTGLVLIGLGVRVALTFQT